MTGTIIFALLCAVIFLLFYVEAMKHNETVRQQLADHLAEIKALYAQAVAEAKKL